MDNTKPLRDYSQVPRPMTAEDTPHGRALNAAVYKAVDQLEGQGARSDRIALQLLEALARYELALGQQLTQVTLTTEEIIPPSTGDVILYRIEWCSWEHGGGADMQEWKSSDTEFESESLAADRVKVLDIEFAPHFRHRYVKVNP